MSGDRLTVNAERFGGVRPTEGFDVSGTVAVIEDISVDNGAQITVWATDGVSGEVTNGADPTELCGGSMRDNSSDGGSVSSSP